MDFMPLEYPLNPCRRSETINISCPNKLLFTEDFNPLESIIEEKVELIDDVTDDGEDDFFDA